MSLNSMMKKPGDKIRYFDKAGLWKLVLDAERNKRNRSVYSRRFKKFLDKQRDDIKFPVSLEFLHNDFELRLTIGVDSEGNPLTERVKEIINAGTLDLSYKPEHGKYGCLISMQFAKRNGITIGEHIEAFSTADIEPIVADLFDAVDNDELSDDELRSRVKELTESIKTPKDLIVTGIDFEILASTIP